MITLLFAAGLAWWLWPKIKPIVQPPPPAACNVTRHDGPYRICLSRDSAGVWAWRADLEGSIAGIPTTLNSSPFASEDAALADAWVKLAVYPIGDTVIATTREGMGMQLEPSGRVSVVAEGKYLNEATQVITQASIAGDDAAGIVISLLTSAFGVGWNPLRARISDGTLQDAAKRYEAARKLPNATPHSMAKAIMGLPA